MTVGPATARPTELLSLEHALAKMLDGLAPLESEEVALDAALGRVLAAPLRSLVTAPPFDNSAMDGYAVRAVDVAAAAPQQPLSLPVIDESAAGRPASENVVAGTAIRILTGAPLPGGADAVVPLEDTDAHQRDGAAALETIAVLQPARPGAHVRRAGSDLRAGEPLLAAGAVLTPAALAVAAAGGHARLAVQRRPRVAVLATGNELVAPGEPLGEAEIYDSNTVGLLGQARRMGAEARSLGIAGDAVESVVSLLAPALDWADVAVVSGGVSVGVHDVVKDAFARLGRIELWRVAVQPGKPLAFGRAARPAGVREPLLFGLPGNPVSSLVTFELFVRPVLRRLAGHADPLARDIVRARLADDVSKAAGRRAFLRVRLSPAADGGMMATLAGGQGSHVLSALAAADGLAIVHEDVDGLPAGSEVEVIRLAGGDG